MTARSPYTNASKQQIAGIKVLLKHGHVIECVDAAKAPSGKFTEVQAKLITGTKSCPPVSDAIKLKDVITWVGENDAVEAEVRLYDRLFTEAHTEANSKDFLENLNADSLKTVTAYVEPSLAKVSAGQCFQFELHGYCATDLIDS